MNGSDVARCSDPATVPAREHVDAQELLPSSDGCCGGRPPTVTFSPAHRRTDSLVLPSCRLTQCLAAGTGLRCAGCSYKLATQAGKWALAITANAAETSTARSTRTLEADVATSVTHMTMADDGYHTHGIQLALCRAYAHLAMEHKPESSASLPRMSLLANLQRCLACGCALVLSCSKLVFQQNDLLRHVKLES